MNEKIYYMLSEKVVIEKVNSEIFVNDEKIYPDGHSETKAHTADINTIIKNKIATYTRSIFEDKYVNEAWLLGAGASIQHGRNEHSDTNALDRGGLWDECKEIVSKIQKKLGNKIALCVEQSNIENVLSHLNRLMELDLLDSECVHFLKEIQDIIRNKCNIKLGECSPQETLIQKLTARKSSEPRVRIFTTNYDTLIEQAASKSGCVLIDGFSYTIPRKFAGHYYDIDFVDREQTRLANEESFLRRVIHLYKIHGSLNWTRQGEDIIQENAVSNDPLIVYPSNNKYKDAFSQPYFEMMSRFQITLRKQDLRLVVTGFGFADEHIQSAIVDAVHQNPNFQLIINDYNYQNHIDVEKYCKLKIIRKNSDGSLSILPNVVIIFSNFEELVANIPSNIVYDEETEKYAVLR